MTTVFWYSNICFNTASILYVVAFVLYSALLVSEKLIFSFTSSWVARMGWLLHTTALILRWIEAGIGHPPWTNLYESLVFFAWGVMAIHLFLELRSGFKLSGVFASAVVFVAMGIASLHPNKEIEPLVPALQSWWLLFHVFMACIAYAFFLGSSFFSIFYLFKDGVALNTMRSIAALVCVVFLALAAGKAFFLEGDFKFYKVVSMKGIEMIMNFKDPEGNLIQRYVSVPYGTALMWMLLALYSASGVCLLKAQKIGSKIYYSTWLVHTVLVIDLFLAPYFVKGFQLKSNPYRLAAIVMTLGITTFFIILDLFKHRILKQLPSVSVLDRWGYQSVLLGVPFMTLNLVSGAVWAFYAWGRYWGWDPKETWALITWFIYVIYLHARILGGWKGRPIAVISILGFFVVIFTYLGVNLVISGLHSYATG